MLMMDTFVNEKDFSLLNYDRYTFEVLKRIIRGDCELILTNHQDLMICHSESPYPVWIWTPDDASDKVKENAWTLMNEVRPLTNGYRINLKYELAEYFLAKAAQSGMNVVISMNLFAYDCPSPKQPDIISDGSLYCCTLDVLYSYTLWIVTANDFVEGTHILCYTFGVVAKKTKIMRWVKCVRVL